MPPFSSLLVHRSGGVGTQGWPRGWIRTAFPGRGHISLPFVPIPGPTSTRGMRFLDYALRAPLEMTQKYWLYLSRDMTEDRSLARDWNGRQIKYDPFRGMPSLSNPCPDFLRFSNKISRIRNFLGRLKKTFPKVFMFYEFTLAETTFFVPWPGLVVV